MPVPDFQQTYYQLFGLPASFELDEKRLGERYRKLQGELHPDRYAGASAHEQRLAVQYSAFLNEAYTALRKPLGRALYLLTLAGLDQQEISRQPLDGGFLIMQMELREKLESIPGLVDPLTVLDHLVAEIRDDIVQQQREFSAEHAAQNLAKAAGACVKMQYLDKLLREAEQIESDLLDT